MQLIQADLGKDGIEVPVMQKICDRFADRKGNGRCGKVALAWSKEAKARLP
jgi:hypothetical protein